ncbi:hypothetical protein RCH12_003464 [Cryobacterium sp. MP_3.1]|uniref:hypothetical protein n=1 Tax=Cryobacterium sp. MP_3.1 TaxID=3071711 RepID=UPI002E008322|nr:hypothetical protein [Cryobacterium sp. MP_3.1]
MATTRFWGMGAVGGALLLAATVLALGPASTGAAGFCKSVRDLTFGTEYLHLN